MAELQGEGLCSLGWALCDWIEDYLCHGPGDLRGEPIKLDDEFAHFIVRAYELDPVTGRRRVTRAFLSRAKGRAKSELAGMLTSAELLGPVRFDGWDANHEPVGRPVRDPFIRNLATEEQQAGNTFDNARIMLEHVANHHGDTYPGIDVGLTRIFLAGGGEIRPSTAASASKDGGKETFCVADESHLYVLPELRSMHDMLTRNLAKRSAIAETWMLETSTMYQPGQMSVAEATHDYWREVQAGRLADRGLLFDHRDGPIPENWDDDEEMLASLRTAYGAAADWMDLGRVLTEIRDPKTTRASACRYFLNRAVAEEEHWVLPQVWAALAARGAPEEGTPVALGFDGSDADDATALIGATMSDPPHLFVLGIWANTRDDPDWHVDRQSVSATVSAAFGFYQVARMLCDPPYWQEEIDEWAGTYGDKVVAEYPTYSYARMAPAVERLTTAIAGSALTHDGDPVLTEHVGNAHKMMINPRRPEAGFVLVKDRKGSPRKIDAAVAAVLALEARGGAIAAGWAPKPKRRSRVVSLGAAMAGSSV